MKYEISIILNFDSIATALNLFNFLDSKKNEASPELDDNAPSLNSVFGDGYQVTSTFRLDTQNERDTILNYIQSNQSLIQNGKINYHDCYHDEGGSCENMQEIIIGDYEGELV